MNAGLGSLALQGPEDIVAARQLARRVAEMIGLDRQAQTRIATAVSEIARNAFQHGQRGHVGFHIETTGNDGRLLIEITDRGPGIADVDSVLHGRGPTHAGPGGLVSARRLVDTFEIESGAKGTTVRLGQRFRGKPKRMPDEGELTRLSAHRVAADPFSVLVEQDQELIASLNELRDREVEASRLSEELEETNRGVVALYSELEHKAEQLRSASDLKSQFLSHMSHEFRTPLNSILALSRLLADRVDGSLNDEQAKQVEFIRRSAQGLLEMVNDLLDLAKVEAGRLDVRVAEFTVASLFATLRGSLKPLLANSEVELIFEDPSALPGMASDEQKVAQILRNFIANALRFTERGHVQVSAHASDDGSALTFRVADTGVGIAQSNIEEIFEEFSQIPGRLQRGGTGLGLPLSRRLARLLGGDVSASSVLGQGSTFALTVPRSRDDERPSITSAGGFRTVLVVDDEEAFRYVMRHIAEDLGFGVIEAADGIEGLDLATTERPDLIVLDLHMPRMSGFDLLAQLQRTDTRDIPVLVCTSHVLTADQEGELSGAKVVLSKQDITRERVSTLMRELVRGGATP